MERDKSSPKRRERSRRKADLPEREPVRLPTDDPAEAVERVLSRRQLLVEDGDIVIAREAAGIMRGTFGIDSLT
ncbi:MAG TPA: hypothetical protein VK491_01445, partial [Gemmatimonadaceae bacterium]|nr:hypothetical protein [Gemmatimonadaceae bacterium]